MIDIFQWMTINTVDPMSCMMQSSGNRRQTVLLKKVDLYTNIAQNWFQTEQLTQYYNTNFSPLTERK